MFSFRYCNVNISEPVRVCVELVKPSDDSRSEEEEFFYTPITNSNMTSLNVKRETVLRNIDNNKMEPVTPRNVYNGGGYVTEVKHEASDSPWKQMTSQAAQMTNKQRVDPYSKVVLTEGSGPGPHLGLCGVDYAGGLAASNRQVLLQHILAFT